MLKHTHTHTQAQLVWVSFFLPNLIPITANGFSSPNNKPECGNADTHLVPPHTRQISKCATCLPLSPSLHTSFAPFIAIALHCASFLFFHLVTVMHIGVLFLFTAQLNGSPAAAQPERLIMLLKRTRVIGASVQQLCGAWCFRCVKPWFTCKDNPVTLQR